jgi:hypothetical protein
MRRAHLPHCGRTVHGTGRRVSRFNGSKVISGPVLVSSTRVGVMR